MHETPYEIAFPVTHEHIALGKQGNNQQCPIALAAAEAGYADVSIGATRLTVVVDGRRHIYVLSENDQGFIKDFDRYGVKGVQPREVAAYLDTYWDTRDG